MDYRGFVGRIGLAAIASLAVSACDLPDTGEATQEVVTTDLSAYTIGNNVVVTYSNMGGAATDWIGLSRTTDASDVYEAWQFTGGGASGQLTFTAPNLGIGTFEARAYYDWAGTSSYTIQQTSPSFTFGGAGAALSATAASYPFGSDVPINFSGFSGSTTDWIGIFPPNAPNDSTGYVAWQFTNGGTSGQLTFPGLASGTYEARYFADWAGTHAFAVGAISPQFTIGLSPTITTDLPTYGQGQVVTEIYANLPGNLTDWVAVSVAGSPATSYVQWAYTNGQVNGTQGFSGLPSGSYEARAYVNNSFTIIASSTFTVTGTTVTTDASSYTSAQPVTVTYAGMPGNMTDWIGISVVGTPDASFVQSAYTLGQVNGMTQFTGLSSGTYEARAYYNNTFTVSARSAPFTVAVACTPPGQTPVLQSVAAGDLVIDATTNTATTALAVNLSTSILFITLNENEPSPAYGGVACDLTATGVTCQKYIAGTDSSSSTGVVNVHWTVATFSSGVTVQRGTANTNSGNPATITLSAVDPTTSFVLMGGEFGGGTGWGNNEFVRGQLLSGTSLEVRNAIAGSTVSWQVVSMIGASVQRGNQLFASGDLEHQVPIATAPSGSLPLASYTTSNGSGIAAASLMMQTSLLDANTLDLKRNLGGSSLDVSWEVVSLPYATIPVLTSFGTGQTTASVSIPSVASATSVAITGCQGILGQSGGSTTYNGADVDLLGEAAVTLAAGAGIVTVTRATSQASATIPWTVIDFAHNCAGQ